MHHGYSTVIQPSPYIQDNSNMSGQSQNNYGNISNMMFQQQPAQHHGGKHISNITPVEDQERDINYRNNADNFQQLPPQLQAPNLTAHIQAAMSTRPKAIPRNKSDPNLSQSAKLHSKKREGTSMPTLKKPRRQQTQPQSSDKNKKIAQKKIIEPYHPILPQPMDNSNSLPAFTSSKYPNKSTNIPILPKSTSDQSMHEQIKQTQMLYVTDNSTYIPVTASPVSYVIVSTAEISQQTSNPVGKDTVPRHSQVHLSTYAPLHNHSMMSTHSSERNSPVHHPETTTPSVNNFVHSPQHPQQHPQQHQQQHPQQHQQQHQLQIPGLPNVLTGQNINESQLVQLAQLLQNIPQGNEATLSYLELLQQQLQMMLKHQQEKIQFKQQLEQQAGRMLSHSSSIQSNKSHSQQQFATHTVSNQISVQSPVIVSSSFSQQHEQYHSMQPDYSTSVNQVNDSSPPPEMNYSRQSSLEIPLPKSTSHKDAGLAPSVTQAGYAFTVHQHPPTTTATVDLTNALKQSKVHSYRQELANNDTTLSPSSSASTTLDSAIALVALRHGSAVTTVCHVFYFFFFIIVAFLKLI